MRWMNLEPIIKNEVSQKEKDKHYILKQYIESRKMALKNLFLQGIQKNLLLKGNNVETDIENRLLDMGRGEERVRCMERVNMENYITVCKIDSQREFAIWLRKLKQGLCINLEG